MQTYLSIFQLKQKSVQPHKFFAYRNKKYPFIFHSFVKNSSRFCENRKLYESIELIDLLSNDEEKSIETFISLKDQLLLLPG